MITNIMLCPLLDLGWMAKSRNSQCWVGLLFCVLFLFTRLQLEVEFIPNSSNEDDFSEQIICRKHTLVVRHTEDLQQRETTATPRAPGTKRGKSVIGAQRTAGEADCSVEMTVNPEMLNYCQGHCNEKERKPGKK